MYVPRQIHWAQICMGVSKSRLAATKTNSWLAHRMGLGRFRETGPGAILTGIYVYILLLLFYYFKLFRVFIT
jgi:hypothetical protein